MYTDKVIFIIEESLLFRNRLREFLIINGFTVYTTSNISDAGNLSKGLNKNISYILLDYKLGNPKSLENLFTLYEKYPGVPVITMISLKVETSSYQGRTGYHLVKPFYSDDLLEVFENIQAKKIKVNKILQSLDEGKTSILTLRNDSIVQLTKLPFIKNNSYSIYKILATYPGIAGKVLKDWKFVYKTLLTSRELKEFLRINYVGIKEDE